MKNNKNTEKKNSKAGLAIALAVAVIIIGGLVGYILAMQTMRVPDRPTSNQNSVSTQNSQNTPGTQIPSDVAPIENDEFDTTIIIDGQKYKFNRDLETVLLLGIDQSLENSYNMSNAVGVYLDGGRSDVLSLMIIDKKLGTSKILEISRDTIVSVDYYDKSDNYIYSANQQIALQYATGSSARRSCFLTKEKVSELLYGIPIGNTISFTMDGIATIVDALGGVTITLDDECTNINPAYTAGATVTLNGKEAEEFVRNRDTSVTGSNDTRMEHQNLVIFALADALHGMSDGKLKNFYDEAEPYMTSDVGLDVIRLMANAELEENILKVPGGTVEGQFHDEYHVDDEALRALLIELFYLPA